jgi:predicted dehydrogenase
MAINFTEFEYGGERSDILDNAYVTIEYPNGIQASFNLCMFAPMFFEEMVIVGKNGRLKVSEEENFLPSYRPRNYMEVALGTGGPSRITNPCYPTFIQESGHGGSTFFEHINLIDNIEGIETNTATVEEGFWSVVVGVAAEESVKTGQPIMIEDLLHKNGLGDLVS